MITLQRIEANTSGKSTYLSQMEEELSFHTLDIARAAAGESSAGKLFLSRGVVTGPTTCQRMRDGVKKRKGRKKYDAFERTGVDAKKRTEEKTVEDGKIWKNDENR